MGAQGVLPGQFGRLYFIEESTYRWLVLGSLLALIRFDDPVAAVNGMFWIALVLASIANGTAVLTRIYRDRSSHASVDAFPFVAAFYALISANFQIPIYRIYTAGVSVAGWLWMTHSMRPAVHRTSVLAAMALAG